ncbi:uncharacterized protein LTR77_011103 [Saxophila tyrrhenica]|uniref:NADPH-dependent FMN reductase-like domain-containing protein n=1 Tax=Saxophila tyrrhenica TaxID=1690608 RepID=A0AAV9NXM8_9PEZI|nr:hypothetical protein LTR77_011103 [Saxophila tyrrhenica]
MRRTYTRLAGQLVALTKLQTTYEKQLLSPTLLSTISPARAVAKMVSTARVNGDLNNTEVLRKSSVVPPDPAYSQRTLAIQKEEDNEDIRVLHRPFLLHQDVANSDWISKLELSTALKMAEVDMNRTGERLKVLVLYGSLRSRSYSKLLALECARILFRLGCDVRVYDPAGLPVKDDVQHDHPKVQQLRDLSKWSDGHVWVSPEQHGTLTGVFKNQIDWIPLSTGSVRPTQGRTLAIAEVSGGSQSFNAVNMLRILGRWMRMFTIPNQSSVPKAYTQFTDAQDPNDHQSYIEAEGGSRMKPSGNRERLVDCMEEFVKYTIIMRQQFELFNDRYSERAERAAKSAEEERAKQKAGEEGNARSMAAADLVNGVDVAGI